MKLFYKTQHDRTNTILGYVIAKRPDKWGDYLITRRQYLRAFDRRTIGGVAGMIFCDKDGNKVNVAIY